MSAPKLQNGPTDALLHQASPLAIRRRPVPPRFPLPFERPNFCRLNADFRPLDLRLDCLFARIKLCRVHLGKNVPQLDELTFRDQNVPQSPPGFDRHINIKGFRTAITADNPGRQRVCIHLLQHIPAADDRDRKDACDPL